MPARHRTNATATRRATHSCEPAEKHQPGDGNRATGGAHRDPSRRPARQQAEGDAAEMQTAGGDDEACRIGQRVGAGRKLGAVRMAVEDRERADDDARDPQAAAAPPAPPPCRARRRKPRCRSRRRAAARRECRARRRTPSPAETRPAECKSPARPGTRPTGRPPPSPPHGRARTTDATARRQSRRSRCRCGRARACERAASNEKQSTTCPVMPASCRHPRLPDLARRGWPGQARP